MPLPQNMRQIFFNGAGGPEVIELEETSVPKPGANQVLIEVHAAGVNRPDCIQREGKYPPPPGASNIPGLEVGGKIVAVGDGVSESEIGRDICALVSSGGYAEYVVADLALCLPIPKGLSMIEAAGLPENYFTVYDNVFNRGRLQKGERFLVHGGSSGIGSTAVQLAKAAGAIVYATAGTDEKCAFCRSLGATEAINYRTQDFVEEIRRLTDKSSVDVILDMVGGEYIPKNLSILALEGRLVQIAFLKSPKIEVDFRGLMVKRLTFTGSTLRPRSVAQKAVIAADLRTKIWPMLEAGTVKPIIDKIFTFDQTRQAHALMETSAHSGKIMLKIR